jgi:hypothetical protein
MYNTVLLFKKKKTFFFISVNSPSCLNIRIYQQVLGYTLFSIGPLKITPARIITGIIVTKTAHEIYIAAKYADREKKVCILYIYVLKIKYSMYPFLSLSRSLALSLYYCLFC